MEQEGKDPREVEKDLNDEKITGSKQGESGKKADPPRAPGRGGKPKGK